MSRPPRTAAEWQKLVGKEIRFMGPTSIAPRRGIVEEVAKQNVRIDGDWYWTPYLTSIEVVAAAPASGAKGGETA